MKTLRLLGASAALVVAVTWLGACEQASTMGDAEAATIADASAALGRGSAAPLLARARTIARHDARLSERLADQPWGFRPRESDGGFVSRGFVLPQIDSLGAAASARAMGPWSLFAGFPAHGLELRMTLEGASGAVGEALDGHVVYPDAYSDTDLVLSAGELGTELSYLLRSTDAPSRFGLRLEGSATRRVRAEADGGLAFLGDDGRAKLRMLAPYAVDAAGERRAAKLAYEGDRLTISLETRGLVFPVLLDPAVELPIWELVHDGTPRVKPLKREWAGMAYDEHRQRTVLFGGRDGVMVYDDTWEWDGISWSYREPAVHPPKLWNHVMTYDAERRVVVLFGGENADALFDQTWTYDGVVWTKHTTTVQPKLRKMAGFAYDRARKVAVLAGGISKAPEAGPGAGGGAYDNTTWEWDGATWTDRQKPSPRTMIEMGVAYDPVKKVVVFEGGQNFDAGGSFLASSQRWNGDAWNTLPDTNPAIDPRPRMAFALVTDTDRARLVSFGGLRCETCSGDTNKLSDLAPSLLTREWDGSTWATIDVNGPPPRLHPSAVYDAARKKVVVFGGAMPNAPGTRFDDTWEYDTTSPYWAEVGVSPEPRFAAAFVFDQARKNSVLYGGHKKPFPARLDDTWVWDGRRWERRVPKNVPRARVFPAVAYDAARARVVMRGGEALEGSNPVGLPDTWTWDGRDWTLASTESYTHKLGLMAYDPIRSLVLLTGGYSPSNDSNLYSWDGSTWSAVPGGTAPLFKQQGAAVWDSRTNEMLVDGGNDGTSWVGSSMRWNGLTWSATGSEWGGAVRGQHAIVGDPQRKRLLSLGGGAGPSSLDLAPFKTVREWDGSSWKQLSTSVQPSGRKLHGMTYDVPRQRMVVFSGDQGSFDTAPAETWELSRVASGCGPGMECPGELTCVDGVCCSTACGGGATDDCVSCAGKDTGGPDGVCAPIACSGANLCVAGACQGGAGGAAGAGGQAQGGSGGSSAGGAGAGAGGGAGGAQGGSAGEAQGGSAGEAQGGASAGEGGNAGQPQGGGGTSGGGNAGQAGAGGAGQAGQSSAGQAGQSGAANTAGAANAAGAGQSGAAAVGGRAGDGGGAAAGSAGASAAGASVSGGATPLDGLLGDSAADGASCGCHVPRKRESGLPTIGLLAIVGLAARRRRGRRTA